MEECAKRTDGRAREIVWGAWVAGRGVDQRSAVERRGDVLLGVVNGKEDPFVNREYIDEIRWGRLWRNECIWLDSLGHAAFWEKPEEFVGVLKQFTEDCVRVSN